MVISSLLLGLALIDKKGLQVQMTDDALALGIRQAAINVQIGDYLTDVPTGKPLPGTGLYLRDPQFASMSRQVSPLTRRGIRVLLILLARKSGNAAIDRAVLHPNYCEAAPNRLSAFNVVTDEGQKTLREFSKALSEKIDFAGWIVGNETNSHWFWANQGRATLDEVADMTERSLRIVHEASKKPVYLSLDHHWTGRADDEAKSLPSRPLIERIAQLARMRGDFGWRVAFHPYPENLFVPRFWQDKTAPLAFDAPQVTFKNLEVLTEFLKRPELTWKRKPRAVNLTEQGFHRPDGADGEAIQAAAYAYAWNRVKRNSGIEGFILHRHVDHAEEGGLRLGLWTNRPGSIADPGRKTMMYNVFAACGTEAEEAATAFALPIVGLRSWNEAAPQPVR